jgi:hypothetical protein
VYYKVPINNGLLDIDYDFLETGIQISENESAVKLRSGAVVRPSWILMTEADFETLKPVSDTTITLPPSVPTLQEQIISLQADNLILMDALATTFEEVLALREQITTGGV